MSAAVDVEGTAAAVQLTLPSSSVADITQKLHDATEATPIALRHRCLFSMRNMATDIAFPVLAQTLDSEPRSQLLRHEVAYALGQMRSEKASAMLREVATNPNEHAMVRHEAAEALGAIADTSEETTQTLQALVKSPEAPRELRETAALAIRRINKRKAEALTEPANAAAPSPYLSVDPADPLDPSTSTETLEQTLLGGDDEGGISADANAEDVANDLERRYGAIFALRDRGSDDCARVLCRSLVGDVRNPSALLRHEVAYVLGQMENAEATDTLVACLSDDDEHVMVRHEAAEALGAVAASNSTCRDVARSALERFRSSAETTADAVDALIVRESCEVALDLLAREERGEFEYVYIPDTKRSVSGKRE